MLLLSHFVHYHSALCGRTSFQGNLLSINFINFISYSWLEKTVAFRGFWCHLPELKHKTFTSHADGSSTKVFITDFRFSKASFTSQCVFTSASCSGVASVFSVLGEPSQWLPISDIINLKSHNYLLCVRVFRLTIYIFLRIGNQVSTVNIFIYSSFYRSLVADTRSDRTTHSPYRAP